MADQSPPHPYIPNGPVETSPGGFWGNDTRRRAALDAVLAGVDRGAYGQKIIDWLLDLDDPTIRTFAYLMWQCRLAGRAEAADPAPACRHCGDPVEPCPHGNTEPWPFCAGWRHKTSPGQPTATHHCDGRGGGALAEPAEENKNA